MFGDKRALYALFGAIIILIGAGAALYARRPAAKALAAAAVTPATVLYFVPASQEQLAPQVAAAVARDFGLQDAKPVDLRPEAVQALGIVPLEATSAWSDVMDAALRGELEALILHKDAFSALSSNDIDTLRLIFRTGVVVAAIGVPGEQLATDVLQMPLLYNWTPEQGYRTSYFYYLYSVDVEGTPEEKARVIHAFTAGATFEEAVASLPPEGHGMIGYRAATDSLFNGGVAQLLMAVKNDLAPIENRPAIPPAGAIE